MSQSAEILRDLKRGHHLSPLDALKRYGCFRLGARIYEMRRKGHIINAIRSTGKKKYAIYSLIKAAR